MQGRHYRDVDVVTCYPNKSVNRQLTVCSLSDDKRRYRGQIKISISGDIGSEDGLGGSCRG
jgi:hypothetical protein